MSFKNDYIDLLRQRTKEYEISDKIHRISTPLLDRNNDAIEVYIIQDEEQLTITDDGYIINDLISSGLNFKKDTTRYLYLNNILGNHGVDLGDNNDMFVKTDSKNYAIKMYMLTQCMSKVSDLFVLNKPTVFSLFNEDVKEFLKENEIRFIENPIFIGKSKLTTPYDFAIPSTKKAPERILKTTASINLNFARTTMFGWLDTKEKRDKDSILYLLFDDRNKKASDDIVMALHSYDIKLIDWTNRESYKNELIA